LAGNARVWEETVVYGWRLLFGCHPSARLPDRRVQEVNVSLEQAPVFLAGTAGSDEGQRRFLNVIPHKEDSTEAQRAYESAVV
jgi:hypothetical protein